MREARKLIGDRAWIISKLEKPSAIEELDEIIQLSDAIMVARGDLGVECPIQNRSCYAEENCVCLSQIWPPGHYCNSDAGIDD